MQTFRQCSHSLRARSIVVASQRSKEVKPAALFILQITVSFQATNLLRFSPSAGLIYRILWLFFRTCFGDRLFLFCLLFLCRVLDYKLASLQMHAKYISNRITFTSRTSLGDRSFTVAVPRLWNNLPLHLHDSEHTRSPGVPPVLLKTHLFCWGQRRLVTAFWAPYKFAFTLRIISLHFSGFPLIFHFTWCQIYLFTYWPGYRSVSCRALTSGRGDLFCERLLSRALLYV